MKRLDSILILAGAAILAYVLDLARGYIGMLQSFRLTVAESLWLSLLLNVLFAGLMLALARYALVRSPLDRATRWIYLAAGLLIMLLGTPLFFGGGQSLPVGIPYRLMALDPGSYFILSGSFIALIGVAGLLKKV